MSAPNSPPRSLSSQNCDSDQGMPTPYNSANAHSPVKLRDELNDDEEQLPLAVQVSELEHKLEAAEAEQQQTAKKLRESNERVSYLEHKIEMMEDEKRDMKILLASASRGDSKLHNPSTSHFDDLKKEAVAPGGNYYVKIKEAAAEQSRFLKESLVTRNLQEDAAKAKFRSHLEAAAKEAMKQIRATLDRFTMDPKIVIEQHFQKAFLDELLSISASRSGVSGVVTKEIIVAPRERCDVLFHQVAICGFREPVNAIVEMKFASSSCLSGRERVKCCKPKKSWVYPSSKAWGGGELFECTFDELVQHALDQANTYRTSAMSNPEYLAGVDYKKAWTFSLVGFQADGHNLKEDLVIISK